MKICIVSDVHYKYHSTEKADLEVQKRFLSFLDFAIGRYDLLVLCGDIFDLYNEYRHVIIREYFGIYHRLAKIAEAGCRIVYLSGNHDFWFDSFLSDELGVELYPDNFTLQADGKTIIFSHGDLYTVNDLRYHLLRRFLRLPITRTLVNLIHPDWALVLGAKLSRSSRVRQASKMLQKKRSMGLKTWAKRKIMQGKADIVVMGHSHEAEILPIGDGFYANAGEWIKTPSYLEITDGNIELRHYTTNNKENEQ